MADPQPYSRDEDGYVSAALAEVARLGRGGACLGP